MKKIIREYKLLFIGILLGGVIFGGVKVLADSISSSSVEHELSNGTKVSAEAAMNDLYDKVSVGNATAEDIISGKTALVGGQTVTGTMPNYNANQGYTFDTDRLNTSFSVNRGYHAQDMVFAGGYYSDTNPSRFTISQTNGTYYIFYVHDGGKNHAIYCLSNGSISNVDCSSGYCDSTVSLSGNTLSITGSRYRRVYVLGPGVTKL